MSIGIVSFAAFVMACYFAPGNETASADSGIAQLKPLEVAAAVTTASAPKTVFVPVYSSVGLGQPINQHAVRLASTVSVHNVSRRHAIVLHSVTHYDDAGRSIREHLDGPSELGPMSSVAFVAAADASAGTAAKFLVRWSGPSDVDEPLIEAVAVGRAAGAGISFTSVGRPIETESLE